MLIRYGRIQINMQRHDARIDQQHTGKRVLSGRDNFSYLTVNKEKYEFFTFGEWDSINNVSQIYKVLK